MLNQTAGPETNCARILGVYVDRHLNFQRHTAEVRSKSQNLINFLKVVGNRMGGGDRKTLLQIFKTALVPKMLFGIGFTNGGSKMNENPFNLSTTRAYGPQVAFYVLVQ